MVKTMHVLCQLEPYRYFSGYAQVIHRHRQHSYWLCQYLSTTW